jgi:O-methyltransferase involved in polyketide biosynthesis
MVFRKIIEEFLLSTAACPRRQIVSLGCGFDTIAFEYGSGSDGGSDGAGSGASPSTVFFELDYSEIVEKKAAIVLGQPALSQRVLPTPPPDAPPPSLSAARAPYGYDLGALRLLAGDLRDSEGVARHLAAAGVHWAAPTLVLTECVLVCK